MWRKIRQHNVCGLGQNGPRIWIVRKLVGVDETAYQLVVAISGKAILVEIPGSDRLRIESIQLLNSLPGGLIAGYRLIAREGRDPLPKGPSRTQTSAVLAVIVVRLIHILAAEIVADGGLAGHRAEWLHQAIFVKTHENGVRIHELLMV